MKHLNANLDSITNVELKGTANGTIRPIGVDSGDDIVAVPGLVYNEAEGTTIPASCELFGVNTITLGAGTGSSPIVFDAAVSLTIPITQGETLDFFLNTDVTDGLIPAGTEPQFSLIAAADYAIGATGVSVTDASLGLLTTAQLLGLNNTTLANCTPALTVDGPGGGDLCVTGNLLLGGKLTDKDGNDIIVVSDDGDIQVDGDIMGGDNDCTPIMGTDIISVSPPQITNMGSTVIKIEEGKEEDYLVVGESITFTCGDDSFDGEITDVSIATDTTVTTTSTTLDYTTVSGINSYNEQADLNNNNLASGVLTLETVDGLQDVLDAGDALYFIVPSGSTSEFGGNNRLRILYVIDNGSAPFGVQYSTETPKNPAGNANSVSTGITFSAVKETTTTTTTISECLTTTVMQATDEEYTGGSSGFASPLPLGSNILPGSLSLDRRFFNIANVVYSGTSILTPSGWQGTLNIVDTFSIPNAFLEYYNALLGNSFPLPEDGALWVLRTNDVDLTPTTRGIYRVTVGDFPIERLGFENVQDVSGETQGGLEYTGDALSSSYLFTRIDTSDEAVGSQGALNPSSATFEGFGEVGVLTDQTVVQAADAITTTSAFSAGSFTNTITVPTAIITLDSRYATTAAAVAALPGELNITLPGLEGGTRRGRITASSEANGITFTLNYTNTALTYTPTDGTLTVSKEQTTSQTVSDAVESADTESTDTETVTVLGVCITVENIIAQADFAVTDASACSLVCSTASGDVGLGGGGDTEDGEGDGGDTMIDGDADVDGDLNVDGSGEMCDDTIPGWGWPTVTTTGNSNTFTFSSFTGPQSIAARLSELNRQLQADNVEFRLDTPVQVTEQGSLTVDASVDALQTTATSIVIDNSLGNLNAADIVASANADQAAVDDGDTTVFITTFITIGSNRVRITGATGTTNITLTLGDAIQGTAPTNTAAGALVSINYVDDITQTVELGISVSRGVVATASGGSISFSVNTALNDQSVLMELATPAPALTAFGLTNCPAITANADVVITGGDLIILKDADGDGGDLIVDGDVCVGDDLDVDGDLEVDGDIILPDDNDMTNDPMLSAKKCTDRVDVTTVLSSTAGNTTTTYVFGIGTNIQTEWKVGDLVNFYADATTSTVSFFGNLSSKIVADSGILNVIVATANVITGDLFLEVCPAEGTLIVDGDMEVDGDLDVDGDVEIDGDIILPDDDNDNTGDGIIRAKECTIRSAITEIVSETPDGPVGTVYTGVYELATPLGAEYKQGDVVEFWQTNTIATPLYTGTLLTDASGVFVEVSVTSTTAVFNPGSFLLVSVCPATGGIIIDGDDDGDGIVEIDGDGNIDGDGDINMDGDGNFGGGGNFGDDLTGGGDLEFFGYTFDAIWTQDVVMTSARMFPNTRQARFLSLEDRGLSGTNDSLAQFIQDWINDNGALGWTNGPKVLISIDPEGIATFDATEENSYVYQAWARTVNASGTTVSFFAIGKGVDFTVKQGAEIVDLGGDFAFSPNLPLMEARAGGFNWSSSTGEVTIGTGTQRLGDGYVSNTGGLLIAADQLDAPTQPTTGLHLSGAGLGVLAGSTMNVTIDSDGRLGTGSSMSGGGLGFGGVVTANTTLAPGNAYLVNATSNVTLTLPGGGTGLNPTTIASVVRPSVGDMIEIRKRTSTTPYSVTINSASYQFEQSGDSITVYDDIEGQGTAAGDFTFGDPPRENEVNFSAYENAQQDLIITNNNPNESFKLIYASNELGWIKF